MWRNLQSYPKRFWMKQCDILAGSKRTLTPPTYFPGVQDFNPPSTHLSMPTQRNGHWPQLDVQISAETVCRRDGRICNFPVSIFLRMLLYSEKMELVDFSSRYSKIKMGFSTHTVHCSEVGYWQFDFIDNIANVKGGPLTFEPEQNPNFLCLQRTVWF